MSQPLKVTNGVLPRVKTFCVGEYDVGTPDETICTHENLAEVVHNFKALSAGPNPKHRPPIAKGHEANGEDLAQRTDQPALGWVTDCWLEGNDLYTKWEGIPDDVATEINSGKFRYPSAEFYDDPAKGNLPGSGWTLRRVVLLGATPPRNKKLGQLVPLAFGEKKQDLRFRQVKRYKRTTGIKCFAEVTPMDRKQLEDQLASIGMSAAAIQALSEAIPDDTAFQNVVMALMAEKAGGAPAAAPAETAAAEPPPRQQMIDELVAMGENAEALAAMDDAALWALYQEKKGIAMSEPAKSGAAASTVSTPAVPGGIPKTVTMKFSEKALQARLDAFEKRQRLLEADQQRRINAEKKRTVEAHCDRWVKEGYVLPGDVDPKCSTPNLYHQLMNADTGRVKKFGEKSLTDFDAMVASIDARGPHYVSKFFSEKIADPGKTKANIEQAKEAIKARYGVGVDKGKTLEARLGMLTPPGMR